jgi:hypothetical protein
LFVRPGVLGNQPDYVLDRWTKPGQLSTVQRFNASSAAATSAFATLLQSNAIYSDGSFIRLRNTELKYRVIKRETNANENRNMTGDIFISAQNLFTITKFTGLDPETLSLLPPVRVITGGIRLNF